MVGWTRAPEVKTLQLGAAEGPHCRGLFGRFDALSRRFDPESGRERQDGMDDGDTFSFRLRRAANEALVDLDFGKTRPRKIAKRGIAFPEIVDDQAHTKLAQSGKR